MSVNDSDLEQFIPRYYNDISTTPLSEDIFDVYHINVDDESSSHTLSSSNDYAILSFIMSAALILPALTVISKSLNMLCNNKIKCVDHHSVYFMWIVVSCLFACILNLLNLFDNILNKGSLMKSGRSCYYIYVFESSLMCAVGFILCCLAVDILMNIMSIGNLCCYHDERKVRIHFICIGIIAFSFAMNNLPDILGLVMHTLVASCWKGNAFGVQSIFVGKVDLGIQSILMAIMVALCLTIRMAVKKQLQVNCKVATPDFLYVQDEVEPTVIPPCSDRTTSDVTSKIEDHENNMYKTNKVDIKTGERKSLKHGPSALRSSQRKSRKKIDEKVSSESSGHENSGYLSDTGQICVPDDDCFLEEVIEATNNIHCRKRLKSDSDIQKSYKSGSKKSLEDHVLYALENFFSMDPTKLIPTVYRKGGELTESLIPNSAEEFEETSFMSNSIYSDIQNKSDIEAGKISPQTAVGSRTGEKREIDQHSESLYKLKKTMMALKGRPIVKNDAQLEKVFNESSHKRAFSEKRISNGRRLAYQKSGRRLDALSNVNMSVSTGDISETSKNMMQTLVDKIENKNHRVCNNKVAVSAIVHTLSEQNLSTTEVRPSVEVQNSLSVSIHNDSNLSVYVDSRSQVSDNEMEKPENVKQVSWDDETDIEINVTQSKERRSIVAGSSSYDITFGDVASAQASNADFVIQVDIEALDNITKATDGVVTYHNVKLSEKSENCSEGTGNNNVATEENVIIQIPEISVTSGADKVDNQDGREDELQTESEQEVLTFKEYHRKYLVKPFNDVSSLMLCYIICVVPQLFLDVYRITTQRNRVANMMDGIMSVVSDVSAALLLLVVSVVFLWRFQNRRDMARHRIKK